MKINTKRVVSVIITAVMMVVMLPSFAMGESGKKYTETLQPEGWTLVENEGGATLSYTKLRILSRAEWRRATDSAKRR